MPLPPTTKLPIPKSWDEFEDIISDIVKFEYEDPFATRYGRTGQRQNGIDIFGNSKKLPKFGVQCRNKENINKKEILEEIKKAEQFRPPLKYLIFATTSKRNATLQTKIAEISEKRLAEEKFEVRTLFWEDISLILSGNRNLLEKYFPQFGNSAISFDKIKEMILHSKKEDWIFSDEDGIYTYKNDVNLTIKRESFDESHEFEEEWVSGKFLLHKAHTSHHNIFYGNSFIKRIYMVSVDGYRAYIPYPHMPDLNITLFEYRFGRIINDCYNYSDSFGENHFDKYLKRLNISMIE
ncbi:MAG: hypothetical protein ABIH65_03660 [Nanoarchaeota archaeon]